jgi:Mg-chelatase subunit ChlD
MYGKLGSGRIKFQEAVDNVLRIFDESVDDGDYVSMAMFNHEYQEIFPLTIKTPHCDLRRQIENCQDTGGGTAFRDSVITALDGFPPHQDNCWLIVLTDGGDNQSKKSPDDCRSKIRDSNVRILVIGFMCGTELTQELKGIVSAARPGYGTYASADDSTSLANAFSDFAAQMEEPPMQT